MDLGTTIIIFSKICFALIHAVAYAFSNLNHYILSRCLIIKKMDKLHRSSR